TRAVASPVAESNPVDERVADPMPVEPDSVLVACLDAKGACTRISRRLAQRLGAVPGDLIGQPLADAFGPLQADAFSRALRAAREGAPQLDVQLLNGDDRALLAVELAANRDAAGQVQGFSLAAIDATARQRAFDEAARAERRLRIIMDQIPVTVS